jgi:hypothetical protein
MDWRWSEASWHSSCICSNVFLIGYSSPLKVLFWVVEVGLLVYPGFTGAGYTALGFPVFGVVQILLEYGRESPLEVP